MQRDSLSLDLTRLRGALDERTREVVGLQARNDALRSSLACRRQDIQVRPPARLPACLQAGVHAHPILKTGLPCQFPGQRTDRHAWP